MPHDGIGPHDAHAGARQTPPRTALGGGSRSGPPAKGALPGTRYVVPDRSPVGAGLLPETWGDDAALVDALCLAYEKVMDDRAKNFFAWRRTLTALVQKLRAKLRSAGLCAAPFDEDAFWSRIDLPVPASDPTQHIRLIHALLRDYQDCVAAQIQYRHRHNANVHLEITGPPGMAKSSCAISIINWIRRITPSELMRHLSIDVTELPSKIMRMQPGESVIQDEYVQTSGEGSRTAKSLFENLEDTLRGSQVNLIVLSPRRQEHSTMQAIFDLIMWNPERRFSLFLVWIRGTPMGVVAIPWAPDPLWEAYGPWKAANVERTLQGQFRDTTYLAKLAMQAFQDPRLVEYILHLSNKPKKSDFKTALEFFLPQMISGSQSDRMVNFIHDACYNFEAISDKFLDWFGVEPCEGFQAVARRCYKE